MKKVLLALSVGMLALASLSAQANTGAVPEPGSIGLVLLAIVGVAIFSRKGAAKK